MDGTFVDSGKVPFHSDTFLKMNWAELPMKSTTVLTLAILCALSQAAVAAEDKSEPEELVITGVRMDAPLELTTDPKNPRQPLPANDGADYLKTIPGFSVVRKGGTDGDPLLRGMAGSRISMLMDGEVLLGGCNNRMDPPTAYVFPETFDSITVIKGPQTVKYGPGNSAGVVLFERKEEQPDDAGWKFYGSVLGASFGRHDEVVDARYNEEKWSVRASASNATSDDYEDGDGTLVHSEYHRWNGQLDFAWKPDADTRVELSTARSDGEAAYADRSVDGTKFARENYSAKLTRKNISPLVQELELQAYYNYVDHVMDNYGLRELSGMMATPMAMNPDRETTGAKLAFSLQPTKTTDLEIGLDSQANEHTSRNTMNEVTMPYEAMPRSPDGHFEQVGLFAELGLNFADDSRLVSGMRVDNWNVTDERQLIFLSMMASVPNPLVGQDRQENLYSGFVRYEQTIGDGGTTGYVGIGHNERFPDYWEILSKETETELAALNTLDPEKNTQLDFGLIFKKDAFNASASFFYNDISDYIMVQTGFMKEGVAMDGTPTMRSTTIVRNIDARTWGIELDGQYRFTDNWRGEFTLASVRGSNITDDTTLAQLPPLEARLGLYYDNSSWSAGMLWRALASQDRVDIGKGNIVGQDFATTPSANVLSLNAGWKASDRLLVTAGIDNLLNETYAEHVSRSGAAIAGFDQIARVNEPGRVMWMKAQYQF
jgi:iron complex outermembrane receptor protein